MTTQRTVLLALGTLCILMFIIMVGFLIFVMGKSVGDMYLACMIVCLPIGLGLIKAAYMEGNY